MFENEKQFERLVKNLKVDDSIDSSHKARLRAKVLLAHNNRSSGAGKFKIASLSAAAIILVCLVVGKLVFHNDQSKVLPANERKEISLQSSDSPVRYLADSDVKTVATKAKPSRVVSGYDNQPKITTPNRLNFSIPDVSEPEFVKAIRKMADDGDIAGLVGLAKGEKSLSRFLAIKFLTDIFDANAVEILTALESDLDVNDPNSPFYQGPALADEIILTESNEANVPAEPNEPNDVNALAEPNEPNDVNALAESNEFNDVNE